MNPKISIIAAIGENREMGKNNKLIWHISDDLKRFKKITLGHPIIMGRKTYESIGKPLPDRTNIIVTRYTNYFVPGTTTCNSLEEAIQLAKDAENQRVSSSSEASAESRSSKDESSRQARIIKEDGEIFVIGGGDIFEQILPQVDKLYLTIVHQSFDADTFFPQYQHLFKKVISQQEGKSGKYTYTFLELER